ncbi:hypothetical protein CCACVL1_12479 [Corchorus capsularis]|uniref:Uncharacterized protein n=1 Tax=Corchorus capsularis TaxID=210143 RepID=A0A1R3IFJ8_COCAP|nr:hypothetical protein CCACVL1_12479 [Corchorus capsularis]
MGQGKGGEPTRLSCPRVFCPALPH